MLIACLGAGATGGATGVHGRITAPGVPAQQLSDFVVGTDTALAFFTSTRARATATHALPAPR